MIHAISHSSRLHYAYTLAGINRVAVFCFIHVLWCCYDLVAFVHLYCCILGVYLQIHGRVMTATGDFAAVIGDKCTVFKPVSIGV